MRAALAGIAVAAVSGGLLAGAGLDVAGAAAAVTVPMASLAALRVLGHAADRTQPDGPRPVDFGPPRPDTAGPPRSGALRSGRRWRESAYPPGGSCRPGLG